MYFGSSQFQPKIHIFKVTGAVNILEKSLNTSGLCIFFYEENNSGVFFYSILVKEVVTGNFLQTLDEKNQTK